MQALRRSSVALCSVSPRGVRSLCRSGAVAAVLAAFMAVALPAHAQVLAVVNGVPITTYDVDQRAKLSQLSSNNKAPGRKEILEELIDEKVKITEARKFGLEASPGEVDGAFSSMASRMGMKSAQLEQMLGTRGVNAETLKSRIRADLVWGNLVRGRYQASLQVGEGDIRAVLGQGSEENAVGHVYSLRPILFIVPRGSAPTAFEARRRDAEAFRSRVSGCDQAVRTAREMRDVAVRDPVTRDSASLPAQLRTMLNGLEIGQLTSPEATAQGVELFAICGREVTRAETPRAHETRQGIYNKRFEEQSKRYLEQVRRSSLIEYK